MKKILNFNSFKSINEAYEEDPEYRIKKYFNDLEKDIKTWFETGSLSLQDVELYDIEMNTTNNLDKYMTVDFQDENFYYQLIFIISLQEVNEDTLKECFIKVKRYDLETSDLLKQSAQSVMVKDINEDKIIELMSDLDNEKEEISEGGSTQEEEPKEDIF